MRSIIDRDPEYDHDADYAREEALREKYPHRYRDESADDEPEEDEPGDDISDDDFINHGEYPAQPYEPPQTFSGLYGRPSL